MLGLVKYFDGPKVQEGGGSCMVIEISTFVSAENGPFIILLCNFQLAYF